MNNILQKACLIFLITASGAYAKGLKQFPYVTGDVLFQFQADSILSTKKKGVSPNNGFIYIQPNISLNFNKNWSVKTQWRIQPNDVLTTQGTTQNPERYRSFLGSDRGANFDENGFLVEEIKVQFENEDLRVFAGKFDPTFGTAWRKSKRIGVFAAQMTEDYNLREKLGGGVTALLENSNITFNTFMNDTTGLSRSALSDRGRAPQNDGLAGNTGTLSSYSVAMEGENFLSVDDLFYNVGYRSLDVENITTLDQTKELGYVFGTEYLYRISRNSSLIPFAEVVKIKNFTGTRGRSADYRTFALIGKYSSWTTSVSFIQRDIKASLAGATIKDRQLQFSVGYKFTDNLTIDVSRADMKENGDKAALVGAVVSYLYKF
jgi:hypothetical protein